MGESLECTGQIYKTPDGKVCFQISMQMETAGFGFGARLLAREGSWLQNS